jgi:hypothetical protein
MFAGSWNDFAFDEQIDARMADKELRCEVMKAFARIDRDSSVPGANPLDTEVVRKDTNLYRQLEICCATH